MRATLEALAVVDLAAATGLFVSALSTRSVSLAALSIPFFTHGALTVLLLTASDRPTVASTLRNVALLVALLILTGGVGGLILVASRLSIPASPWVMIAVGAGALATRLWGSLQQIVTSGARAGGMRAALLAAREDVVLCAAVIVSGILVAITGMTTPDLIIGLGILVIALGRARAIFTALRVER